MQIPAAKQTERGEIEKKSVSVHFSAFREIGVSSFFGLTIGCSVPASRGAEPVLQAPRSQLET